MSVRGERASRESRGEQTAPVVVEAPNGAEYAGDKGRVGAGEAAASYARPGRTDGCRTVQRSRRRRRFRPGRRDPPLDVDSGRAATGGRSRARQGPRTGGAAARLAML